MVDFLALQSADNEVKCIIAALNSPINPLTRNHVITL